MAAPVASALPGRVSLRAAKEVAVAQLDVEEFLARFRERAEAVKTRGIPPLEGEARRTFIEAAELDYQDYALIGGAEWAVEADNLVLRIRLA